MPVADRTFCVESEFASRNDGFQPMLKAYDVPLGTGVPRGNVRTLHTGAVYEATARGACTFGEVFTTDGRIKSLHLDGARGRPPLLPELQRRPGASAGRSMRQYPQIA